MALQEWDLTASLPQVAANMGIESVEWVSNANVSGKLYDQNTKDAFDAANYPNAVAGGVFFVALEDNGHVYAYVLNEDGSSIQIADIDSKLGGAMALDYDTYENVLWVVADNGFGNRAAKVTLTGEADSYIVHVSPASGVDATSNNEGFTIAEASFTKDGQRPVYRFHDGVTSGALTIGSITCDYGQTSDNDQNQGENEEVTDEDQDKDENSGKEEEVKDDESQSDTTNTEGPETSDTLMNRNFIWMLFFSGIVIIMTLHKKFRIN